MRSAFTRTYRDRTWHQGSGPGSGEAETAVWREFLRKYLHANAVTSVLDLGCGDWQSTRLIDWTGIAYHGIDIVKPVIEECRQAYSAPGITFECGDILTAPWPPADLIICKEVLQHWPLDAIRRFQERAMFRWCLLVNDYAPVVRNPDIKPGGYRPLDLSAPPFGWPVREVLRYTLAYADGTREVKVVQEL